MITILKGRGSFLAGVLVESIVGKEVHHQPKREPERCEHRKDADRGDECNTYAAQELLHLVLAVEPGQGPHREHVAEDEQEARGDLDRYQQD